MKKRKTNNTIKEQNANKYIKVIEAHLTTEPKKIFNALVSIQRYNMKSAIPAVKEFYSNTDDTLLKHIAKFCLEHFEATETIPLSNLDFPLKYNKPEVKLIWELLDEKLITALQSLWNDREKNYIIDCFSNKFRFEISRRFFHPYYSMGYQSIDKPMKKAVIKLNRVLEILEKAGEVRKSNEDLKTLNKTRSETRLWVQVNRQKQREELKSWKSSSRDKKNIKSKQNTLAKQIDQLSKQGQDPLVYLGFFEAASSLARTQGYLVLEEWVKKIKNSMVSQCIQMICDGSDPALIKKFIRSWRKQEVRNAKKLSEFVSYSLFSIQKGYSPNLLEDYYQSIYGYKPKRNQDIS